MSSNSPAFGLYNTDAALWTASKHAGKTARIIGGHVFIGSACLARFADTAEAVATLRDEGWLLKIASKDDTALMLAPSPATIPAPALSPSQPSPGAMRAETRIREVYKIAAENKWDLPITGTLANIIDRETGAGELAEALQNLVDCYGVGWKTTQAFCEAVKPLMEDARAALARYNSAR